MNNESINIDQGALEALFSEVIYVIEEVGQICVVISQSLDFEGSADYQFLENVLKAVKIEISNVKISNIHSEEFKVMNEGVVLLFGVNAFEAGYKDLTLSKYEVFEKDELRIIEADKLGEISLDVNKKKALWLSLKRVFNV